jgi:hypothetical protein
MGLRTLEGVRLAELTALDLDPGMIVGLADAGLVREAAGRLAATRRGRGVLDRVTLELARSARAG